MKKSEIMLCTLIFAFTNTIAGKQSLLSDAEIAQLKTEVMQATIARNSALEAGDADLAFSYFSHSPGALEASSGSYHKITDKTLEGMREFYGAMNPGRIDIGIPQIRILGPESAIVFVDGTWSFVSKKTQEEFGGPFIMTLVWVKEDGVWRVFHKHESELTKCK